ncbi:hypothetical protein C8J57DRAFT_1479845 [Mycena rebaudengoi]|nr:hypothetical protein C8J57DRAFT_1479845 [Mycena rebaudengoi]
MEDSTQSLVGETTSQLIQPRGEFIGIIILRALILSGIVLGIPAFAVYSIIYIPLRAHIRLDTFIGRFGGPWEIDSSASDRDVIIAIRPLSDGKNFARKVTAFSWDTQGSSTSCPYSIYTEEFSPYTIAKCPVSWSQSINITVSLTFPQNTPPFFHVLPGQGEINDILTFTDPILVLPGNHLFAYMTWTSRRIISKPSSLLSAPFNPWRTVQHMEVNTLLNINHLEASEPFSSTVTLLPREHYPTKWVQESAATTPLDGISTVGGLWTFVEGVFVLLFGANVIYFAFGRRPLAALGIVHLFQRRGLIKQWHEDFPALHDEGGRPGDASAGIVAFIRERLVDLDPVEGQDVFTKDLEAQGDVRHSEIQANCAPHSPPGRSLEGDFLLNSARNESSSILSGTSLSRGYLIQARYRLDDIPLAD